MLFFSSKEDKCCCATFLPSDCCWNSCPNPEDFQESPTCGLENMKYFKVNEYHNVSWHDNYDNTFRLRAIQGLHDKLLSLLNRSAKVCKSNAFAYFSILKLAYAMLK